MLGVAGSTSSSSNPNQDVVVPNPPVQTVTQLRWSPAANFLSCSGWSKEVRIWDVANTGQATPKIVLPQSAPILCCDWLHTGDGVVHAACDGIVRLTALERPDHPSTLELGTHAAPVKCVSWNKGIRAVISGSWDKSVRFFDPRRGSSKEVLALKLGERVHAMDSQAELLAVGLADRTVVLYDIRQLATQRPLRDYTAPFLDRQSTSLVIFPDRKSFALASIEGRVQIQYLVTPDDKDRSFVFRCHRVGNYDAYAVNALAATDAHETLATAGSDGSFVFWDKEKRKRLHEFKRMANPITAIAFNRNGTIFAYATGYDWSRGAQYHDKHPTNPQIFVHGIEQHEITMTPD
jgi:mRNA export factor